MPVHAILLAGGAPRGDAPAIGKSFPRCNAAWRGVMFIAQNIKCSVEVSFIWRNKEGAEHPGKIGSMRIN
jgi:hypothetical protein